MLSFANSDMQGRSSYVKTGWRLQRHTTHTNSPELILFANFSTSHAEQGIMAAVLGRIFADKYRIDAELGAGAVGVVYRAHQLDLDRDVAIKLLHAGAATRPEARLRFVREAKTASRLIHPGAIGILDFGEFEGQPFLVMELLHGEALRDRMASAPLPLAACLRVVREVASALEAAHAIRLTHRDIKPENIFLHRLTSAGSPTASAASASPPDGPNANPLLTQLDPAVVQVRVVDFGLAFVAETDDASVARMTQEGIVGGTPAYMSPEQVHGKNVGPAADIYALGCTLFEMLAHRPLFEGSLGDVLTRQAYAPPPDLMRIAPDCGASPAIQQLLHKMLAKTAPLRPSPAAIVRIVDEELARLAGPKPAQQRGAPLPARAERAFSLVPTNTRTSLQPQRTEGLPGTDVCVLLASAISDDFELGMVTSGARVEALPLAAGHTLTEPFAVIWAPGEPLARLAQLCAQGVPVVTDVPNADFAAIIARLHAGAADVVPHNSPADEIARHLFRTARAEGKPWPAQLTGASTPTALSAASPVVTHQPPARPPDLSHVGKGSES